MSTSGVVTYDKSWCVQLDQSKMCLIAIVFRSWSCSFPPVEVVDQSAVQNSQTVLVALLSLMLLMKVSNADSRGESSACPLYPWSFLCPLFGRMRLSEHRVYFTVHAKLADTLSFVHFYYFCSSFPWRVSGSCAFHADTCSLQNKKGEAKKRRVKTYVWFDISYCDSFPCPCSCLPSTVTCWRSASSPQSESRTPGRGPGPSTQAVTHQIKTTHKGRFVLLPILFRWMQWGWKVGKACLWKWAKDLKHLVDSVMLSVLENALGVCHMSIGNVQCCAVTVQKSPR